ncbi:hypothetical protein TIFTF001_001511 [Ficus carica]|uniref:Cleft lip and palate associated transmembrane protein n=1 Tax=Ficus carica TaxID=3494 RepID=A0AA87Z1Y7_FICCA|nr:hypothetical protein TIFTF001_001511 [Ficus carica]
MAPPAAERREGQQEGQGQGQGQGGGGGIGQSITGIIRIAVFWYFASKFLSPKSRPSDPSQSQGVMSNLFQKGEALDMWVYLSEKHIFNDFSNESALLWHESNIPYSLWGPHTSRTLSLKFHPSQGLKQNGSMYAHVFFARSGYPPDPYDPEFLPLAAFATSHRLPLSPLLSFPFLSFLSDADDSEVDPKDNDDGPVDWVSYWKPNITINLVDDFTKYPQNAVPPNIAPCILDLLFYISAFAYSCLFSSGGGKKNFDFLNFRLADLNVEPSSGNYYPTVFFNEFWLLRDKLIQLNETVTELPLNLEVSPISLTKWQLFLQIDQSFQIHRSYGSMLEGEADELKMPVAPNLLVKWTRVFLEGNPYLLAITMVVSLLHSVFDFLAFKNDIQFWNKNKSMEGLSAKSVIVSFISQLIVFLYLLDNDTSWMILASSGIGCCIEFWKIGKAMHIEIDRTGQIPMLRFRDRESYAGNKTKEYDDIAMKYLSYLLFFLVACSAVYSLKYERHKSCFDNFLMRMVSAGFIMMCPQLFINYKLKSVAHLPWRQMTYKFLNTIIDDLFAFVIKMPTLHRLSVFRDVDKKRVNEFGFGGEDDQLTNRADAPATKEDEKKTN